MNCTLCFLLAFSIVSISAYECENGIDTINPPSDLSQPTYYPSGWSDGQALPHLKDGLKCALTVNIPNGYYTNVTFYSSFMSPSYGYILYSNNKITIMPNGISNSVDGPPHPFVFVPPFFKVNFQTADMLSIFTMKIVWAKFPNAPKNIINIYKGNAPVPVVPNGAFTTFVGGANSMMSLAAFSLADPSMDYLLRQSVVFGGDSFDSGFVGTLDQVLTQQYPLTVNKNKISVYTFGLSNLITDPLFMGLDYEDTRGVSEYVGVNCPSTGNCKINLNGYFGNSITVTYFNGSEFVKSFDSFPDTAIINVYENMISNTTRIASLTSSNYLSQLPLEVKGTMKLYELNGHGVYNMTVTRNVSRGSRISH